MPPDTVSGLSSRFPPYTAFGPAVPVRCVTPGVGRVLHRFYDTSPFSPSDRYLGLTRLPSEDRLPHPGDTAEVVVVDLEAGEERVVATTQGWGAQVGAHVQWGASDADLLFNDVDTRTWRPFGVHLDLRTGRRRPLDGTVYTVSPDGWWAVSPDLAAVEHAQACYGVSVPPVVNPRPTGAPADRGVFLTSVDTGATRLLVSLRDIVERAEPRIHHARDRAGGFCAFHVKWNPQGDRLMVILRWLPAPGPAGAPRAAGARMVVTMNSDGTDPRVAVPAALWQRGHHPTWCPDGQSLLMNLRNGAAHHSLVRISADGRDVRPLCDAVGSGHPTLHPGGRYALTDAYLGEPAAYEDGSVPIRLIDTRTGDERHVVRIGVTPPFRGPRSEMRVDPHPAWDRRFRRIALTGCPDGTRRVYVADLSGVL
jgi:hypothetical protein